MCYGKDSESRKQKQKQWRDASGKGKGKEVNGGTKNLVNMAVAMSRSMRYRLAKSISHGVHSTWCIERSVEFMAKAAIRGGSLGGLNKVM